MGKMLYKYTTLESLALILKSKKIRLNPLTMMDDLQEAQSSDEIKFGKYVFISSWMDQPLESIAMWKLYSNMYSGVRIGMEKNPFVKYIATRQDIKRIFPEGNIEGDKIELIAPIEECFNDRYFILNMCYDKCRQKVEYTDDKELLMPKLFDIEQDKLQLNSAKLGKYKNTYWEFQNEERYVLRFLPLDVKTIKSTDNVAQMVYNSFIKKLPFINFFDLCLRDDAFSAMEITIAPQFTDGNRIILETLREVYNPSMTISESKLKNSVKL